MVAVRPSNRKLLLIEVAESLFANVGFTDMTVETIACHAGVPVRVFYNLFGSKAGLLEAVDAARPVRAR